MLHRGRRQQHPPHGLRLRLQRAEESHLNAVRHQQRRKGLDVEVAEQIGFVFDVDPMGRNHPAAGAQLVHRRVEHGAVGVAGAAPSGAEASDGQGLGRHGVHPSRSVASATLRVMTDTLTLTRPDDWHLHLRDGVALAAVLPDTARQFARAIVMPNLKPPVTTTALASAYRERILAARPAGSDFEPLMTLYLTDATPPAEIAAAKASGFVHGVKLYPAGATTHSDSGVTDIRRCDETLAEMARLGMPLLIHGEVTDAEIDVFDREAVFIDRILGPLLQRHPTLRVVFEHITTRDAAQFVRDAGPNVGATITAHHLLYNRNALFQGGIRPHNYCLPVLKREVHRAALVEAAISGSAKFFLGTDSAPHARHTKEADCGCAGCYTALTALELYAEAFEAAGALDKLEGFASHFGPDFYRLPRNSGRVTLRREAFAVPADLPYGSDRLTPFRAGETLRWQMA